MVCNPPKENTSVTENFQKGNNALCTVSEIKHLFFVPEVLVRLRKMRNQSHQC